MRYYLLLLFLLASPWVLFSQQAEENKLNLDIYGFIRLNATMDLEDMGGSDLFQPSKISVPSSGGSNPNFFMSAKQSRFGIKASRELEGYPVKAVIEVDFHDTATGAGGKIRMRHAYVQYRGFTLGQTWSTFYDIKARPHIVDFEGSSSSSLTRVPMIRYEMPIGAHTLSVAAENPLEQITVRNSEVEVEKQVMPDLVSAIKFNWNEGAHFVKAGALIRQLRYSIDEPNKDENETKNLTGWGAMLTGKASLSADDVVKLQLIGGKGLARYIRSLRGLGYDAICAPDCSGLEAVQLYGGTLALEHDWSDKWCSTFVFGDVHIPDQEMLDETDIAHAMYGSANLFYRIGPGFEVGLEYLYGRRVNQNEENGEASRFHLGATYRF